MNIVVAIATTGRDEITQKTLAHLASLTDPPKHVVLSIASPEDFTKDAMPSPPFELDVILSPKGSSAQRNSALRSYSDCDLMLFIDDDFLISPNYLTNLVRLFRNHEDVVMATGLVLADGIRGPGLSHSEGLAALSSAHHRKQSGVHDVYSAYGCNMVLRVSTAVSHDLYFDEALPLYGWLEDMDLSRRMAQHGRVVRDMSLEGVHLGTKIGRSNGLQLGYSQIANPLYLIGKKTMRRRRALKLISKNITANLTRSLFPEPWINRRGRLQGNFRAFKDIILGRCSPSRILNLRR